MKELIKKKEFPKIGMRIVKSAIAVEICFLVSFLRRESGIVFFSQLAALWCMQGYVANTKKNAAQRFIGTGVGAVYGLIFLLVRDAVSLPNAVKEYADSAFVSLLIVVVLYTTVIMKKKQASYFSCVVFLSIAVNHIGDANPYLFVWNRFLDTVIGIIIGVGVNMFSLPRKKHKDILFVSGLDDTLLDKRYDLSDYSKVELNRMLDDGLLFTISTIRTPAFLLEAMSGVRLKLPVIVMDGAALYDIKENRFLKMYLISSESSRKIAELIERNGLHAYVNVVVDESLIIYYNDEFDETQRRMYEDLRKSPYRNYLRRPLPKTQRVVYFMLFYPTQILDNFYQSLEENGITKDFKVLKYPSTDYPGYTYIKIYNKNASKVHMLNMLKEMVGAKSIVTFGSIKGNYDVYMEPGNGNEIVHTLKKKYEPLKLSKQ